MPEDKVAVEKKTTSVIKDRFKNLFEFLKAYNDLRTPVVRDISEQIATLWLDSLPKHASVKLFDYIPKKDVVEGTETPQNENDILLQVARPTITPCPKPPIILADWLIPGWTKIDRTVDVRESKNITTKGGDTKIEKFEDNPERKAAYKEWAKVRTEWAKNEQPSWEAIKLFERVYELYGQFDREGERVELLIGDGILEYSDEFAGDFRHPVLLKRLELEFLPEKKNPQFIIRRKEQPSELCIDFLRALPEIDTSQLVKCTDELGTMEFDPLGQEDTSGFLRRLIQGLFPNGGHYIEADEQKVPDVITIERRPVIFMRQRRAGLGHAIDLILQDVTNRLMNGEEFSIALMQVLGIDHEEPVLSEEEAKSASLGNEDKEVLLSKPANQEQLQIAKQLEYRNTVLVQGPPGTGKTHTIANLIGHLLSQGKRVLVTAQTPKALRVLRREIVEAIQPLCVSVLQKEKQNIEELQQSVRQISVKLSQDPIRLEKEVEQIKKERLRVLEELKHARQQLFDAREDEIREIVFGGKGVRPIDAAKKVAERQNVDSWIPAPVTLGATSPLTEAEVIELYATNATISAVDEKALRGRRPDLDSLPSVEVFAHAVSELDSLSIKDVAFGKEFWFEPVQSRFETTNFDQLLPLIHQTVEFFKTSDPWQLEAIQAGRDGDVSKKSWEDFVAFIEYTWTEIQNLLPTVMKYGPTVEDKRAVHETLPVINEIVIACTRGRSLGFVARITKRSWFQFLENTRIDGRQPDVTNKDHLVAIQAHLRIIKLRDDLRARWDRQMQNGGIVSSIELGDKPEQICRQFINRIKNSLTWHDDIWVPFERELAKAGYDWNAYFETIKPETGPHAQLLRLRSATLGDLSRILEARMFSFRLRDVQSELVSLRSKIPTETEDDAVLTRQLRQSLMSNNVEKYERTYEELERLKTLEQDFVLRNALLEKIAPYAPAWVSAIKTRLSDHALQQPKGSPEAAWEWRQLHDELERRAMVSIESLSINIEQLNKQLLDTTAILVEKQTWLKQIQTVKSDERQALNAYATLQAKKTKSGYGKKDETIRTAARKEMEIAKGAVPVWIMPLNEVVENFNPVTTRFDVVIVDEASQCDPLALFALYMGKQAIVVGDDEQVTPTVPGLETDAILKLIRTYLDNIPHKEFYDGETSIYDFAKTVFGNVIRLVEHFRCAPDIIAFSNALSYAGEIKPLREESSISLHPNVVPFRVEGTINENNVNEVEARNIAALICVAIKQPEYKKKTFGVISLLGEGQAAEIEKILRSKLSPEIYQQRELLCGTAPHFQGDQRDVMFLSMVDAPADGPLNLRDADANRKLYKKRYNVAVSRAKDQVWLVYSLNNETDLKPGDIRKRLIEHTLDPKMWQRQMDELSPKTESPFEQKVMSYLLQSGYKIQPQYQVGAYRIDMVVSGGGKKVAVECDGEQWHGHDKLQDDLERQAILERLGWKFIRIRGSVFFRDHEKAMNAVCRQLNEFGVVPDGEQKIIAANSKSELIERICLGAQELQTEWATLVTDENDDQ